MTNKGIENSTIKWKLRADSSHLVADNVYGFGLFWFFFQRAYPFRFFFFNWWSHFRKIMRRLSENLQIEEVNFNDVFCIGIA